MATKQAQKSPVSQDTIDQFNQDGYIFRRGLFDTEEVELLRNAARAKDNVMPSIIDAVEAYATVGEICDVLKDVYGTYCETIRF